MQAAAQHFGLVTSLAVQRDEAVFHRTFGGPEFFDDPDLVVGDVTKDIGYAQQDEEGDRCRDPEGRLDIVKSLRLLRIYMFDLPKKSG